jgi:hypothetical protein
MYELREISPGNYYLTLPLPPGTYQYVFYRQGRRLLDPENRRKAYIREQGEVSEMVVR